MTTTHFLLVDDQLENYEIKDICDSVEKLPGVYSVVSYESLIGGGIPGELEDVYKRQVEERREIFAGSKGV